MRKTILWISLIICLGLLLSPFAKCYCMGGAMEKDKTVNLIEKFKLHRTNKIRVETNKIVAAERNYINKIIQEKKKISMLLNELHNVSTMPIVDAWVHYNLTFYADNEVICEVGFHDEPNFSFLRHASGEAVEYLPNKTFYENFHEIIEEEIGDGSKSTAP